MPIQVVGLDPPLITLLVYTLGCLLVGLLVKIFGDHSGIFAELMLEFGKTGRFDYRNAPGIVITAFVSIISGASLGMGIIGAIWPLTLFSGEEGTNDLITHAAEIGVVMLIVLNLVKLLATTLLLATG
jgi:H+/Cl- antiporter ClcA